MKWGCLVYVLLKDFMGVLISISLMVLYNLRIIFYFFYIKNEGCIISMIL